MFGIGSTELLVILVVALIVLGPKSLANVSRTLGKAMGEFRRVSTDFQRTLNAEAAEDEDRQRKKQEAAAARKEHQAKAATTSTAQEAKPADTEQVGTEQTGTEQTGTAQASSGIPEPPQGSQLAEALNKARNEANGTKDESVTPKVQQLDDVQSDTKV